MTTERDPGTRIVLSWLREDAHENAERVLLRALDEVDATPQRRSRWPARRSDRMNRFTLAMGAAAVIVLTVVGYNLLPATTLTPGTSTPPTSSMSTRPAMLLHNGPLEPGTYAMYPFSPPSSAIRVTVTVPAGWMGFAPGAVVPEAFTEPPEGAAVAFILPMALYVDPCKANRPGSPTISAGTTVDDLVSAIQRQAAGVDDDLYHVGDPSDVTIAGFRGKRIEVIAPSDLDFATCEGGEYWIFDAAPYVQGPGNRWSLFILDVEGTRVVVLSHDYATTDLRVQQEAQAIVDSITIEP